MRDWQLISGFNNSVIKKVIKFFKLGFFFFLPLDLIFPVLGILFIPLGIIDLLFFVEIRWVWWVFGKGKQQYIHTIGSVVVLIVLFLFLGCVSFIVTNILNLAYLDWKINWVVAAIFWFILSAAAIQIIVCRSYQHRETKLLNFANYRFTSRITQIDDQLTQIKAIIGYTPAALKRLDDNINSLLSERQVLQKEKEAIENTITEVNKSRIRLNIW